MDMTLQQLYASKGLTAEVQQLFRALITEHAINQFRQLPWRETTDPYCILVSEIMLQQTQVERVVEKYRQFMARFPDVATLASAPVAELLGIWQGLGYNRRALNLQAAAKVITEQWQGVLPAEAALLQTLPGIGPYTAAAVCVFAFNLPVPLIETNIRAVYIHCFFTDRSDVSDKELMPLIEATFDRTNPRRWCNALMDYGAMLKRTMPNPSRRSAHHTRQTTFHGSHRQLRGKLLKLLLTNGPANCCALAERIGQSIEQIQPALDQLAQEGFVREDGPLWQITPH